MLKLKESATIDCLRECVWEQSINALYSEFKIKVKFYNLRAWRTSYGSFWQNLILLCVQKRRKPACAYSKQSNQPLCYLLSVKYGIKTCFKQNFSILASMFSLCAYHGFHRNSKTHFHDFSMIFYDQQCNFHDFLMHGLQPHLLAASSPRCAYMRNAATLACL